MEHRGLGRELVDATSALGGGGVHVIFQSLQDVRERAVQRRRWGGTGRPYRRGVSKRRGQTHEADASPGIDLWM
jgi:hypothetical protein